MTPLCVSGLGTRTFSGGRINVVHVLEWLAAPSVDINVSIRPFGSVFCPAGSSFSFRGLPVVCLTAFARANGFRLSTNHRVGSPHIFLSLFWCITSVHDVKERLSFHCVEGNGIEPSSRCRIVLVLCFCCLALLLPIHSANLPYVLCLEVS